jgi:type I restriction enzyme S subunit
MNAEELLRHYERVADAPEAIPRLRRFLLDLAVRGRLVPQGSGDESAPLLLRRIEQAKHELIRSGQLRQPRDRDIAMELDKPFKLPSSWDWVRLDAVGAIIGGGTPPAGDAGNFADPGQGIPWLTPADLGGRKGLYVSRGARDLSEEGLRSSSATVMPAGSVLFTSRAPIGYVAIASNPVATNQGFKSVVPYLMECSRYVAMVLQAFAPEIDAKAPGTTFKEVSGKIVAGVPFPLPPLAEQRRIVAKVDELMALCERLEAARAEREAARDRLTAASLARLNTPGPERFREDARFALAALQALTARADLIDQTRQTILGVAMAGKLVPQDPSDEPAAALLSRKASLPSGYQRRRKIVKEASVGAPEALFPVLPASWAYTDVQSLYDLNVIVDYADGNHGALYPRSNEFSDEGVLFVTAKDLVQGRVAWSSCAKLSESRARQLPKGWARGGDVLLTHNATVGRVARVERDAGAFLLGTSVTFYRLNPEVLSPDFFYFFLQSPIWQGQLAAIMAQTTRNQVSIQKQAFFRVVVPPLAEQHRIVARVQDLMAVCDALEASLRSSDDLRQRLLDALLHEALEQTELPEEAA